MNDYTAAALGVLLLYIVIIGCLLGAEWATEERPELKGRVFVRYLAIVLTVMVAGGEGWVDRSSLFLGVMGALGGKWWAERPLRVPERRGVR